MRDDLAYVSFLFFSESPCGIAFDVVTAAGDFISVTGEEDKEEDVNVVVTSDGTVVWIPRVTYHVTCAESDGKINCNLRYVCIDP